MSLNLPNRITLTRILIIPIFLLFVIPFPDAIVNAGILHFMHSQMVAYNHFIERFGLKIAAIVFIIAASTDGVDGYIARKRKLVTKIGIFLDPLADKLMVSAALIALMEWGLINGWAVVVIIGREFIITGFRAIAVGEGVVIAANKWGKIKTASQIVAISAGLLKNYPLSLLIPGVPFDMYFMIIAVIITIYSAYEYIAKNMHVFES